MGLAPDPQFPEYSPNVYERKVAPNVAGQRGPLRFEEGVATDTDVPDDFQRGMSADTSSAPGRPNYNPPEAQFKRAEETMKERAHVGSASWIEAPTQLGEFAHGAFSDNAEVKYEEVTRPGTRQQRRSPTVVDG